MIFGTRTHEIFDGGYERSSRKICAVDLSVDIVIDDDLGCSCFEEGEACLVCCEEDGRVLIVVEKRTEVHFSKRIFLLLTLIFVFFFPVIVFGKQH